MLPPSFSPLARRRFAISAMMESLIRQFVRAAQPETGALTEMKFWNAFNRRIKMSDSVRVTSIKVSIDPKTIVDMTKVHRAMAVRYRQIVQGTFGPNGVNRPEPWPDLSRSYVYENRKRNLKTPTYTGVKATLFRTGTLFKSIMASWGLLKGTVSTDNPYAPRHQFGEPWNRLPARPFFPFYRDGTPTQYARSEMERVAVQATSQ